MSTNKKLSVLFFGTPDFAIPSLEALAKNDKIELIAVMTQSGKPKGRGQDITDTAIAARAKALGISKILQPISLKKIKNEGEKARSFYGRGPRSKRISENTKL